MPLNDTLRAFVFRSLRLGFRLIPMPTATRDRMRQRFLARHADLVPDGPVGQIVATASMRAYDHSAHRTLGYAHRLSAALPDPLPATVVAFYLPQFHPIPENDHWWGRGFTEWRNVTRALPQFEGHLQPKLPADLGFYDLRLPQVMREQMAIAREYGVGAFCTYFYWFAGKTLLEAPLRQWLDDPTLDLPICLCWANENWSRRWDGREDDLLISQRHSPEDDIAFIEHVAPYLRDPRYLRVEGKPMLLVYRPGLLPEPRATAKRWRTWCRANGVGDIHLAYVQSFDNVDPSSIDFDAAVAFPPNNTSLTPITATKRLVNPQFAGQVMDWRQLARASVSAADTTYRLYPGANPGWDNEARRAGRGRTFAHATPRAFGTWMRAAIEIARRRAPDAPMVFVNAWNEWAEGAVLEPDTRYGYAWLAAIRRALLPAIAPPSRPCMIAHIDDIGRVDDLLRAIDASGAAFRVVFTVQAAREGALRDALSRLPSIPEVVTASHGDGDIAAFLAASSRLHDEGEDVVLRLPASARLVGTGSALDAAGIPAVLNEFAEQTDLGVVLAQGAHETSPDAPDTMETGDSFLQALTGVAGGPARQEVHPRPGDAFWFRLAALAPLFDAPLTEADLAGGSGINGEAMAAACLRIVPGAAWQQGFRTVTTSYGPA
jgi:lipopolysaccharide biosynthesis protein